MYNLNLVNTYSKNLRIEIVSWRQFRRLLASLVTQLFGLQQKLFPDCSDSTNFTWRTWCPEAWAARAPPAIACNAVRIFIRNRNSRTVFYVDRALNCKLKRTTKDFLECDANWIFFLRHHKFPGIFLNISVTSLFAFNVGVLCGIESSAKTATKYLTVFEAKCYILHYIAA